MVTVEASRVGGRVSFGFLWDLMFCIVRGFYRPLQDFKNGSIRFQAGRP